jgi:pyridoxamine 5'-phosphate oxidase
MNDQSAKMLKSSKFLEESDPFALFGTWMQEAEQTEPNDPNAMALASVDANGLPNVRIVLMKSFDERGFVFYTHLPSIKGQELFSHPQAALVIHWKSLHRQIRARGAVMLVSDEEADAYFQTRPRESQVGAWASRQSQPLDTRETFEQSLADYSQKFDGQIIPRPKHWSGFRINPISIEFWQDRPFRLHDRVIFTRHTEGGWDRKTLYP